VTPWAEALLGQLDAIGLAYQKALAERGWTTPGLDSLWLSEHFDHVADALAGHSLIFAGFHALSDTEEPLLRRLWERGAEFFWHSDPALARGGPTAWAAQEHQRWLGRWHARAVLTEDAEQDAPPSSPQIRRFFEGFDLHSQLSVLERELAALPDTGSTAIVLPDPGALVPVMHHLPAVEANISMGYPLMRSALAQLVETVLALHENAMPDASGSARYAWRDLVSLVRHPLLRMLRVGEAARDDDGGTEMPLKSAYVGWERHIRAGGAYQSPHEWLFAYDTEDIRSSEEDVRALHTEVLSACFDNFQGIRTLRQVGQALNALCELLRRRGGDTWRRNLIDAECLLRLWQSVVPELTGSILADEDYDQGLIFLILTCYGGGFSTLPAFLGDMFGTKQLGTIHGYELTAWGIAGMVGPSIVTRVLEATGSYTTTLYIFAGFLTFAFVVSCLMSLDLSHARRRIFAEQQAAQESS